jgi:hypothetical protein
MRMMIYLKILTIFWKRRKNYFCQLLNVCDINGIRQTKAHTAEPLVTEPSCFDVDITIEKLKRYISPNTD